MILLTLTSAAAASEDFTVDKSASTLTYHLTHRMHPVRGVSRAVEGRARIGDDKRTLVEVSAPVESFDSGNVNRDAAMKETVEAARFPTVEVKAIGDSLQPPDKFPSASEGRFRLQVSLRGVRQLVEVPVRLQWQSASRVRALATFTVSLEKFGIERPSLMFVKVGDALRVEADVTFAR